MVVEIDASPLPLYLPPLTAIGTLVKERLDNKAEDKDKVWLVEGGANKAELQSICKLFFCFKILMIASSPPHSQVHPPAA